MNQESINNFICNFLSSSDGKIPDGVTSQCWQEIYPSILKHHLGPYFYYILNKKFPLEQIPDHFLKDLQERYYTVATFNTRLFHELAKILKLLREKKIPVILLKGAYLAVAVYDNKSLRPMMDIDLLIKRGDLENVAKVLAEASYYSSKKYDFEALKKTQIHLPALVKPGQKANIPDILVELHWSILRPKINRRIDVDQLWQRSEDFSCEDFDASCLSPEDNLHHLAVHAAFDDLFGNGILPLIDIARIVEDKKHEIDWEKLNTITCECGTERYIFIALVLAKKLINARVDDKFLELLTPSDFSNDIFELAKNRILNRPDSISSQADIIGRTLSEPTNLFRKIFPPLADLSEIYGPSQKSSAIWLYYPVRWKDVFFRYLSVSCRLLFGNKDLEKAAKLGSESKKLSDWLAS